MEAIRYYDPNELYKLIEEEKAQIPSVELFNSPSHKILREKWCASRFSIGYKNHIKDCLVGFDSTRSSEPADFLLKVDEKIYPFQITEVQAPDRKRGKEYREYEAMNATDILIPYRPQKGMIEGLKWIENGVTKKVEKHYTNANQLNLLIYGNLDYERLEYERVCKQLEKFKGNFNSIWLLAGNCICSVFSSEILEKISGWLKLPEE